jgi:hypothetical protein
MFPIDSVVDPARLNSALRRLVLLGKEVGQPGQRRSQESHNAAALPGDPGVPVMLLKVTSES